MQSYLMYFKVENTYRSWNNKSRKEIPTSIKCRCQNCSNMVIWSNCHCHHTIEGWNSSVLVLDVLSDVLTFAMFRLMFQHHAINRNKNKKIKDRKIKNTRSLLTQFSTTRLHLGATKSGRKFTSVVLIQ